MTLRKSASFPGLLYMSPSCPSAPVSRIRTRSLQDTWTGRRGSSRGSQAQSRNKMLPGGGEGLPTRGFCSGPTTQAPWSQQPNPAGTPDPQDTPAKAAKALKTGPVLVTGAYTVIPASQPRLLPGLSTEGLGLKELSGNPRKKGERETTNHSYCLVSTNYVSGMGVST